MSTFFDEPSASRQLGLQIEDKTFWFSEQILAAYSPVFETMFYGQFIESKDKNITLPDKKASDILEMLCCVFPTPVIKEIDESNVNVLLPLADEYQMEHLKKKCERFLRHRVRTIDIQKEELLSILCTASKYGFTPLVTECAKKCLTCCTMDDISPIFPQLAVKDIACVSAYMANDSGAGNSKHERGKCPSFLGPQLCTKCRREETKDICRRCKIFICAHCIGPEDCKGNRGTEAFEKAVAEVMKRKME